MTMHVDEHRIDERLVRKLLSSQFSEWADLPLAPITPAGTDNVMFKLGDNMAVRLPRVERAAAHIEKECSWLPQLAPHLPLPVPTPLAQGQPTQDYPWPWAVCRLLEGENLSVSSISDLHRAAIDVGGFVKSMRSIDAVNGPANKRGLPLTSRDAETRAAIVLLKGEVSTGAAIKAWERALAAHDYNGPAMWMHGDLHPGNLLVKNGRISAVIDFGSCGVGDPAADLMVGWTLLDADSREIFRRTVKPDDASWERGRGWALTMGIVAYPYYQKSNPVFAAVAKRTVDAVLADTI